MGTWRARFRRLAGLAMLGMFVMPAAAASAATITPNVFTDDYDPTAADGECSLREALTAANTNADFGGCTRVGSGNDDTIVLQSDSTYLLSIAGVEDVNASGDLDVTGGGSPLTLQASGAGMATIDGGTAATDRVLDLINGSGASLLRIGITGGPEGDWALNEHTTMGAVTITSSRIFENGGGMRVDGFSTTITDSSVDHNSSLSGIFQEMGTLTIERSTIDHNMDTGPTPNGGGGIIVTNTSVTTNLINSTVSDNVTDVSGGGIWTHGILNLRSTTVAGNTADADDTDTMFDADDGGGLYGLGGSAISARNSLIADNVDATTGSGPDDHVHPDCSVSGTMTSEGYNLIENTAGCTFTANNDLTGLDPLLAPLAPNGGPTLTRALLTGSPAIDAANPAAPGGADPNACPAVDQRGLPRGGTRGRCDIGAFEEQDADGDGVLDNVDSCPVQAGPASNGGCPLPASSNTSGSGSVAPTFKLKAAISKCKKKFPKGPKRKKCIKRAKQRARS